MSEFERELARELFINMVAANWQKDNLTFIELSDYAFKAARQFCNTMRNNT